MSQPKASVTHGGQAEGLGVQRTFGIPRGQEVRMFFPQSGFSQQRVSLVGFVVCVFLVGWWFVFFARENTYPLGTQKKKSNEK